MLLHRVLLSQRRRLAERVRSSEAIYFRQSSLPYPAVALASPKPHPIQSADRRGLHLRPRLRPQWFCWAACAAGRLSADG